MKVKMNENVKAKLASMYWDIDEIMFYVSDNYNESEVEVVDCDEGTFTIKVDEKYISITADGRVIK